MKRFAFVNKTTFVAALGLAILICAGRPANAGGNHPIRSRLGTLLAQPPTYVISPVAPVATYQIQYAQQAVYPVPYVQNTPSPLYYSTPNPANPYVTVGSPTSYPVALPARATSSYLVGFSPDQAVSTTSPLTPSAAANQARGMRIFDALRKLMIGQSGDKTALFPFLLNEAIRFFVSEFGVLPSNGDHNVLQDLVNRILDGVLNGNGSTTNGVGDGSNTSSGQAVGTIVIQGNVTLQAGQVTIASPGPATTGTTDTTAPSPPPGGVNNTAPSPAPGPFSPPLPRPTIPPTAPETSRKPG